MKSKMDEFSSLQDKNLQEIQTLNQEKAEALAQIDSLEREKSSLEQAAKENADTKAIVEQQEQVLKDIKQGH